MKETGIYFDTFLIIFAVVSMIYLLVRLLTRAIKVGFKKNRRIFYRQVNLMEIKMRGIGLKTSIYTWKKTILLPTMTDVQLCYRE